LASGRESDFFIDVKQTALLAEGHALLGAQLLDTLTGEFGPVAAVAGVVLGGCPLASAVAAESFSRGAAIDAIYVRKAAKDHGTRKLVEGAAALAKGSRVAVVEDVVTTGGSTLAALDVLRAEGLEIAGVVAVVDRLEGGADAIRAADVPFTSLFTRADFLSGDAS
jgi:orotate phosphoribosyltransferase